MYLMDTLDRFLLEFLRRWCEIGIFISEQLIRYFACKEYPDIGLFVYSLADKVHSHAGSYGRDIVGSKKLNNVRQLADNVFLSNYYLCMIAAQIVSYLLRIFKVDGICVHTDREGLYRPV